jgi:hypothetical protein
MALLKSKLGFGFGARQKDKRRATRRTQHLDAWVRPDGSFAMQPCKVIDMSRGGVRISVARAEALTGTFLLMTSRDGSESRRVKMKWRKGNQIGAEFV